MVLSCWPSVARWETCIYLPVNVLSTRAGMCAGVNQTVRICNVLLICPPVILMQQQLGGIFAISYVNKNIVLPAALE